jgi:hypothetical protein
MTDDGQQSRETWARKAAHHVVDGVLAAIERYPAPDQMALLREVARRALWHIAQLEQRSSRPSAPLLL